MNEKIAIAYFSHTGNTKQAAKKLQREVGGDLIEIRKRRPYKSSEKVMIVRAILYRLSGSLPALSEIPHIKGYDKVYLGFPIWCGRCPQIIISFAKLSDLYTGTIIPFYTSGGSLAGNSQAKLQRIYKYAKVEEPINMNKKTQQNFYRVFFLRL